MFYRSLFDLVGRHAGATRREITEMLYRESFSKYLPWHSHDGETGIYYNVDDTVGVLYECIPHNFSGERTCDTLEGIFRLGLPERTVVQFNMIGDDHIAGITDRYRGKTKRDLPVIRSSKRRLTEFLEMGTRGIGQINDIPVRNFRLMIAVKLPVSALSKRGFNFKRLKGGIRELIAGSHLYPREMSPEDLIFWARRFLNGEVINDRYNRTVPIARQVILADRKLKADFRKIEIGNRTFRCLTPKTYPEEIDSLKMNEIMGGIWGLKDDGNQILSPFMVSVSVVSEDLKGSIHRKFTLLSAQGRGKEESYSSGIAKRQNEYRWAVNLLDENVAFCHIMTCIWVWGESGERVDESATRVKRLWEGQGYTMQNDAGILSVLFVASLPFGLYLFKNNLENIQRTYQTPVPTAVSCLPTQADFMGNGEPGLLLLGRKGQLIQMDIVSDRATNKNGYIVAGTGSGKSFLNNAIITNYYGNGAILRIVDLGYSYQKATKVFGGKFLEFKADSRICINPFGQIPTDDREETESAFITVAEGIGAMAYSSEMGRYSLNSTESNMLKACVRKVFGDYGPDGEIDHVRDILNDYVRLLLSDGEEGGAGRSFREKMDERGKWLAFNLAEFCKSGVYGRWFNGRSTLNIADDEFVVLELEELKPQKELFPIVVAQVIGAMSHDLYLSDRSHIRFNMFDEAWQFMTDGGAIGRAIVDGYRRARKYGGAFWTITQSIMDLAAFGETGRIIQSLSAYKLYLKSDDFSKAAKEGVIDASELTMELMKSMATIPGRYSEIYFDTEVGTGIGRLVIDPYNYYLYTSKPDEVAEMEAMVRSGISWDSAILRMADRYGG